MSQKTDRVDVVLGTQEGGDERIVSVARVTAERWPEKYPLATTEAGHPTAAARRAAGTAEAPEAKPTPKRSRSKKSEAKTPAELPTAGTTTTGAAGAENTPTTDVVDTTSSPTPEGTAA